MEKIDWNTASNLGLIERINREVLHPLGLAMCRDTDTGVSPCLLVAEDGKWEYSKDIEPKPKLTKEEIQQELTKLNLT
jgi:hypothetical protein